MKEAPFTGERQTKTLSADNLQISPLDPMAIKDLIRLATSLLFRDGLDSRLRELAVLRIIAITQTSAVWEHYLRLTQLVGLTASEIATVSVEGDVVGFGDTELLAIRIAEELSRHYQISHESMHAALDRFGSSQMD